MSDLIKREDAIKAVEECLKLLARPRYTVKTAIEAIPSVDIPHSDDWEKYSDKLWENAYERGKADRQQEWIPCSERLPNEGEVVLVCMRIESHKAEWEEQRSIEFGRINSDRYDFNGTGWEWLNESGADYWQADWNNSILAWMPLPKPWKGADDEISCR